AAALTMANEDRASGRGAEQRRALRAVLALNVAFLVVEVVGGAMFHSLVLFGDAAHIASDVVALLIALGAQLLVERPATARNSYGLQRAEVLGAQASGIVLVAAALGVIVAAAVRLGD